MAGKNLEVLDTIYNRKIPISDSGEVSLPLKSERWTYFVAETGAISRHKSATSTASTRISIFKSM